MNETRTLVGRLLMAAAVVMIAQSGVDYMVKKSVDTYLKKSKEEA